MTKHYKINLDVYIDNDGSSFNVRFILEGGCSPETPHWVGPFLFDNNNDIQDQTDKVLSMVKEQLGVFVDIIQTNGERVVPIE